MGKGQGNDWRLYVANSAPSTDFDPQDSVWDLVGFSTDSGINGSKDLVDTSDKDNPYSTTRVGGRRDYEITETVFAEENHAATDEGQELLWTSFNSDDQSIYFLLSNDVTGDQAFQGQAYVEDLDFSASDNDPVELDITMQIDGSINRGSTV